MALQFLVIELPALKTPVAEWTWRRPDVVFEVFLLPGKAGGPRGPTAFAVSLLRNASREAIDELLALLARHYLDVRTAERDDAAGRWIGTYKIPVAEIADRNGLEVMRFLDENKLGYRWVRLEQGVPHVLAQVPDDMVVGDVVERAIGFCQSSGVDADVSYEMVGRAEWASWLDLVLKVRGSG